MIRSFRMAVAAASLLGLSALAAKSADLGGNCCSDIEERVAELEATTARKGNRKVSLTVSGHVNVAILNVDAGDTNQTTITGNPNSQSRVRFVGEAKIGNGISVGYLLEVGVGSGAGNILTGAGINGVSDNALTIRHSTVWLAREGVGKLWLGKTSSATDGISEISLARTDNVSTMMSIEPLSGTYLFGNGLPFDGSRKDVIKVESASFGGFTASASWSSGDAGGILSGPTAESWDAALRYLGEGGGFRFAAGLGFRHNSNDAKGILTSASIMHIGTGLFINGSYGSFDGSVSTGGSLNGVPVALTLVDPQAYHVQAGIERNWFGFGKTTLYGEYLNLKVGTLDTTGWGMGINQELVPGTIDAYAGVRRYEDFDVSTVMGGMILRF